MDNAKRTARRLLTVTQVAEELRMSSGAFYRRVRGGGLPGHAVNKDSHFVALHRHLFVHPQVEER